MRAPAKPRVWRTVLGVVAVALVAFGVVVVSLIKSLLSVFAGVWKGVRRIIF